MKKSWSPYLSLSRDTWKEFRQDTRLTLSEAEILKLRGLNEPISIQEVEEIYLPLSRLINLYILATQKLYQATTRFLGHPEPRVPYIIGIAGSVAVGKSTVSRILQALLSRWATHPKVELVATDGFLYPNCILEKKGIMNRKGFPESYHVKELLNFLTQLKSGHFPLKVPVYSHYYYNILENQFQIIQQPDIVIVEGLNVLQIKSPNTEKTPQFFVSDFFDFTIYVDAPTESIKKWYVDRFMLLREQARLDPEAFFYRFCKMTSRETLNLANQVWTDVNEENLKKNIFPFKNRARLILEKGENHSVQFVRLRKI